MGSISSKFIKSESKPVKVSTAIQTETPKATVEIMDVRSPTADIVRTPIIVEKLNLDKEFPERNQLPPLKNKLLKTLKMDPRSPSVGIYRTPILVEETPSDKTTPDKCNSPISIYSCNGNDSIMEDLMTPIESSMNVSGFDAPKAVIFGEADITLGCEEVAENEEKNSLKVLDKPNTFEAQKLLEEIISDEENFLKKVRLPTKSNKKTAKNNEINQTGAKGKLRPPLSNITSSTNSPGNINIGVKHNSKNKVFPEFGSENSVTLNAKCMIQWDQNNTVII